MIFSSPPLDGLLYFVMELIRIGVRVEHLVLVSRHQTDKRMTDLQRDRRSPHFYAMIEYTDHHEASEVTLELVESV